MRARLLPLLAAAVAAPAWAAELNVITSVEVKDTGPEVVLSVKGSRKPSFTTFSMADPPRFVIDFSESRFQGVPEETPGVGGVVKTVKALSYGSDASAIARVMIAFAVEVDPPAIEDAGESLIVRVVKPAGAGAAVAAAPDPDAKAKANVAAAAAATAADVKAKAKADADAKVRADADAKAKANAEAKARAEEDRRQAQAKADADAKAKADADAQAKADAGLKAKLDEEHRQAQAKADADAKVKAYAEATARAEEERRQAKALADADAKAKADAEAQAKGDEERRRAQAWADGGADQEKLEAEIAAARAEAKGAKAGKAAPPQAEAGSDADQKALEAEIAAARAEAKGAKPAKSTRSVETVAPQGAEARIQEVGFKQLPEASRVFVRTSSPAEFSIQDVDERTVRIELQNTRAARYNDLRFMDTSFFPSAVQLITPSRQGSSYVLTVKLRQRVPYQQKREGDMLVVDFQRPPATAAAVPPPASAPDSAGTADSPVE
jgi:colicin import membrane protein